MHNIDKYTVLSINPYASTYINEQSKILSLQNLATFSKNQYSISFLHIKNFITAQISISNNIHQNDLNDVIFSKAYDELALDQAIEYKIQYVETFHKVDKNNRNFHLFIINPLSCKDIFEKYIKKIKYIDYIIPAPLLLKSLYTKAIIQSNGVHCFIYFDKYDTFITIYNNQEFIYTKSINYSLEQMHIRFCELYTKYIEYENFINFLTTQSLKDTTSEYKIYILKLYKEIFTNISNILTYVKRVLDINKLDNIYVGSGINIATKLHEIAEVELKIKSSDFNFNYGFKNSDLYVEQLHSLMHIYVNSPTHLRYKNNFNIYNRPLKFTQRQSGKISILVASSLLLSFSFPIYYWLLILTDNTHYEELYIEYKKKHKVKQTRETLIIEKLESKTKLLKILQKEKQNYKNTEDILMKIYDIRVNYHMKANLLYLLTKDLNKKNVKVESIRYGENNSKILTLNLVSNKDKKITDLLKCLTSKYQDKFHFSLSKISFDERENKYFSKLNVGL
jgi:hypothetical protein